MVSGKKSLSRCLAALLPQVDFDRFEIIVPFDRWSEEIGELAEVFPRVHFHFIEDVGLAAAEKISAREHRLYDRRRAVGLALARGEIIAMTEDHAVPADDWCEQILKLHRKPYGVIGGAIENRIDRPLNWAWYYCDFGRFGKPLASGESEYVSDVNVAYKRETIISVRDVWDLAFHEMAVHYALRERGTKLILDERMTVYQERPRMSLAAVLRERVEWGRVFAEPRVNYLNLLQRLIYTAGTAGLPLLLWYRVLKNMIRQKSPLRRLATTLPLALLLSIGWSLGEMLGYLSGEPQPARSDLSRPADESFASEHQSVKKKQTV